MLYTYRFRLYPNEQQKTKLAKHFGSCRFIYNYFLNKRDENYKQFKVGSSYYEDSADLTKLKTKLIWLKETNAQSLQQELKNLDGAFTRFFKKIAEFPKFHSKKTDGNSFCVPQYVELIGNRVKLPKFREGIKAVVHRRINGVIKRATVTMNRSGQYFISLCVDRDGMHLPKLDKDIGIDLGITTLATCSDGRVYNNVRPYGTLEKRLKHLHRELSKKLKGSKSCERARRRLSKLYQRISDIRSDHLHKISHKITNENQVIYLEDLNVESMKRNRRLAKSICDVSLGELVRQIKYKGEWRGRKIITIGKFYPSSKVCHKCNCINQSLGLSDRTWKCRECLSQHDRDLNAAINILIEGRRTVGTTGLAGGPSVRLSQESNSG